MFQTIRKTTLVIVTVLEVILALSVRSILVKLSNICVSVRIPFCPKT